MWSELNSKKDLIDVIRKLEKSIEQKDKAYDTILASYRFYIEMITNQLKFNDHIGELILENVCRNIIGTKDEEPFILHLQFKKNTKQAYHGEYYVMSDATKKIIQHNIMPKLDTAFLEHLPEMTAILKEGLIDDEPITTTTSDGVKFNGKEKLFRKGDLLTPIGILKSATWLGGTLNRNDYEAIIEINYTRKNVNGTLIGHEKEIDDVWNESIHLLKKLNILIDGTKDKIVVKNPRDLIHF